MTIYLEQLTVPAATSLSSPVKQEIILESGSLLNLTLFVPPGPRGEVYLRFTHRGIQLLPSRSGSWWRPDGVTLSVALQPAFPIAPGDDVFQLEGASPFANYTHNILFQCEVAVSETVQSASPNTLQKLTQFLTGNGGT